VFHYGFLGHELNTTDSRALAHLRTAQTVEEAVEFFMGDYEQPGVPALDRRISWGKFA
jgi:hypothetical protein